MVKNSWHDQPSSSTMKAISSLHAEYGVATSQWSSLLKNQSLQAGRLLKTGGSVVKGRV
jgi:hypothetical protein